MDERAGEMEEQSRSSKEEAIDAQIQALSPARPQRIRKQRCHLCRFRWPRSNLVGFHHLFAHRSLCSLVMRRRRNGFLCFSLFFSDLLVIWWIYIYSVCKWFYNRITAGAGVGFGRRLAAVLGRGERRRWWWFLRFSGRERWRDQMVLVLLWLFVVGLVPRRPKL